MKGRATLSSFRHLDPARHPFLKGKSRDEIYDRGRFMAPGGLLLFHEMVEAFDLDPGARILDLGCGRGQSTELLARRFDADVTGVDLWISEEERTERLALKGSAAKIRHIQADIRRGLPCRAQTFDCVFSMQSFHTFGGNPRMVRYIAKLMKPGGILCIAQTCFASEPLEWPEVFLDTDGWAAEYHKYHSPIWWRDHISAQGFFEVHQSSEVRDGDIFWEDDVLYRGELAGWKDEFLANAGWLIKQIAHGQHSKPRLTHLKLLASLSQNAEAQVSETRPQGS